jgi:hypothetical protein
MSEGLRRQIRAIVEGNSELRTATAVAKALGRNKQAVLRDVSAMLREGELLRGPDTCFRNRAEPAGVAAREPARDEQQPGDTRSVEGLAAILDDEIEEQRKLLRKMRGASDTAGIATISRALGDMVWRRRQMLPDAPSVAGMPDVELDREILESARLVVADRLGGGVSAASVAFVVLEEGGGQRTVPLSKLVPDRVELAH